MRLQYYWIISLAILVAVWQLVSMHYDSFLMLPSPLLTFKALVRAVQDPEVMSNLLITLRRVLSGFGIAVLLGVPLGFLMGYSRLAMQLLDPITGSLRQIPIMAWVPLTIVWFGLGDGPTIFLIAFSGVFPVILNTIAGVKGISKDYYNAARSMGAGPASIFAHVIVPGSLPGILTGVRIAVGTGWMSVICAEFIATSAGIGYSMVKAQTYMQTDALIALMILAALVGYALDQIIMFGSRSIIRWTAV
ncbi:MAG: ABC transporter permease subunit SaoP [Chitinophagales bacterium]